MTNNGLRPYEVMKNSHQDWLGKVPNHWKLAKAKRIFRETSIKNHPDEELLSVTQKLGVIPRRLLDTRVVMPMGNFESFKLVKEGHFIISLRSFQGGLECSKYQGIVSPAYNVLEEYIGQNRMYFRHLMKSQVFISELQRNVTGIRQGKNVDVNDFKEIILPIPPRSEQDQIVKYLDHKLAKINKFIKAKKKLIAVLKEQKQAIINEAVTKGMDPNVKMKTSGIEWLGDVPEHWEVIKLCNLTKVILSGLDKKSYPNQREVSLCNYVDVYKNYYIDQRINFMQATASDEEIRNLTLKKGDIVITKDSESWKDIAVPAIVVDELEKVLCAYHLAIIRIYSRKMNSNFLYCCLLSEYLSMQYKIRAKGVTRFGLSYQAIRDAKVALPPFEEQVEISDNILISIKRIDKAIKALQSEISLITEYKNSLISEVVTGKVDVRKIAINESEEEIVEDTELDEDLINEESLKAEDGDE